MVIRSRLSEQQFGNRNTKSKDGVGKEDGAMRLQFLIHIIHHFACKFTIM